MDYVAPSPFELITYSISAEGISWEILQNYITSFLGPEAFARRQRNQDGDDVYWITATKPFITSQLNDLRVFSAELLEERQAAASPPPPSSPSSKYRRFNSSPAHHGISRNHRNRRARTQAAPIHLQLVLPPVQQNSYIMLPPPPRTVTHCLNCQRDSNPPPPPVPGPGPGTGPHNPRPQSTASDRSGTIA